MHFKCECTAEIVDLIKSYNITGEVYVTQLRSLWPGLNIQTFDNQQAIRDGIIRRRSEGNNYHQRVTPEEIALLNLVYRHSGKGLSPAEIKEAKELIKAEFAKRETKT